MINFDKLVLRVCENTFARPVTVTPTASQPGQPAYTARGIWTVRPVDVQMEDQYTDRVYPSIMSSENRTLGIRLSEFAVPIVQGDMIAIDGAFYLVDGRDDDGQGGTVLALKEKK